MPSGAILIVSSHQAKTQMHSSATCIMRAAIAGQHAHQIAATTCLHHLYSLFTAL